MPEKLDDEDLERILLYRRVFGSPDGREVLEDIMDILGLNATIESEAQGALHNAALSILANAGILRPWNNKGFIEGLLKLPYSPDLVSDKELS
jgi:hypothetical protein